MDRIQAFRDQIPYESDILYTARFGMEGQGLLLADLIGQTTQVGGLACIPTTPASLNVKVGPGRIYSFQTLEASPIGQRAGTGGLAADTNVDHKIVKQGLLRDTQTFAITPPGTAGQSMVYLIEAQFQEADDAPTSIQLFNSANPNAPLTDNQSPFRRCICALQLKAGTPAATGSQTQPATDAGWVPVWAITVAFGATTITSGNIAAATGSAFVAVSGGGGGGSSPTPWTTVTTTYTAVQNDFLIADTSGGAFTIHAPAAPVADNTRFRVKVNGATNNLTIDGNGHNFNFGALGVSATFTINKDGVDATIVFDGTNWRI